MKKMHEVAIVDIDEYYLYLNIDGQSYRIPWQKCSQRLNCATLEERSFIQISPSGYGLHWPLIDEDLAVDPLLKIAEKSAVLPIRATEALISV
jgi:hypothetical protein